MVLHRGDGLQPNTVADYPEQSEGAEDTLSDDSDAASESERKEKLLTDAKANFKLAHDYWQPIFKEWLDDVKFASGDQWPADIRQNRDQKGRPCLVINRLPQFIQQVTNDQRQNRPSIKVHPIDDEADIETAKVIQGLTRHIEYNSNADAAYDTAVDGAVKGGLGFIRVVTDYCDPESFDQEILIKRVPSPLAVLLDPSFREPDGSDASYGFVYEDLTKDAFSRSYPDSELAGAEWNVTGTDEPEWVKDGGVRVVEYFYKEYEDKTLHLMPDGQVLDGAAELEQYAKSAFESHLAAQQPIESFQMPEPVKSKQAKVPVIKWCKLSAAEILEETDWPGKYIPIIPVLGAEQEIDGKRTLKGIVRDAKDAQRMLNYWKSAETEAIALAPRAPFIAAAGQIEGFEAEWREANRENHAVLEYNPKAVGGQVLPPPQRSAIEPAVQAITQAALNAADDLKATTGIYDPSLGMQRPDQSGIAIQRLNQQAQTSNFHFTDNLTRSLRHLGRIIVDLMPRVYDTARSARIIGDDDEQKIVKLNEQHIDPKTGKPVLYALDAGKYDVTIDVGPSYASKRQEAVTSILDFLRSFPQAAPYIGDVLAKNFDWPGADVIAERLKKMLPPQLQDDGKQEPIPPQVQAQMQQMGQMVDQLTQQLHATKDALDKKIPEIESKERIEMAKLQAEIEIAMAKMGSQESLALLQHQIGEIEGRVQNLLNFTQPIQGSEQFAPQAAGGPMPAQGGDGMQPGGMTPQNPIGGGQPPSPSLGDNP